MLGIDLSDQVEEWHCPTCWTAGRNRPLHTLSQGARAGVVRVHLKGNKEPAPPSKAKTTVICPDMGFAKQLLVLDLAATAALSNGQRVGGQSTVARVGKLGGIYEMRGELEGRGQDPGQAVTLG